MNEAWLLYLFTRLDEVKGVLIAITVAGFFAVVMGGLAVIIADEQKWARPLKWIFGVTMVVMFVNIFIPTSKDLAIIVGGTMLVRAAQTPEAKELGTALYNTVMQHLTEETKEKK